MKIIYAILFFADTLLLVVLAFLFMQLLDNGANAFKFALIITAMICCIVLLVYFLSYYMKLPPGNHK